MCNLWCIKALIIKSGTNLYCNRLFYCLCHSLNNLADKHRIFHKCRTFSVIYNLWNRTSHIDIYYIKWSFFKSFCHICHNLRV